MDEKMDELEGIIQLMMPALEAKVSSVSAVFNLWFGDLKLVNLNETSAVFTTPTRLRRNILVAQYKDTIEKTLEEVIGFHVDVEIYPVTEYQGLRPEEPKKEIADIDQDAVKEGKEEEEKVAEYLNSSPDKRSLLDDYTFENFVEGSSNKFARAACYAVANEPNTYNPLFIYGHSGLGKTHLLYAVIHHMRKNHPELKIVYKKCETFLAELITAIKSGTTAPFKEKYRSADVLLIDDVQFLAGKEQTQEEFFHTFSALYEADKQIILTSDRPPKEI